MTSRNLQLFYVHNFLTDLRFQEAFLIIYFAQISGSYTIAMAVLATVTLTKAISEIPTGVLSDKIGRKYTITTGSACVMLSLACYALAANSVLLFIGAILSGLSQSLFSGNNNAFLYETLKNNGEEEKYHHHLGKTNSMFQLALALSALIASFFVQGGLKLLFLIGIIPQFLAILVSLSFVEMRLLHTVQQERSLTHLKKALVKTWNNPRLRLLTLGQSLNWGMGEAEFNFTTVFINTLWPTWAVALYRGLAHSLGFVGFWFSGRIIDHLKHGYVLAIAPSYHLVAGLIATTMLNVFSPLLLLSGSIVFGPQMVACEQLMQNEFSHEQRATMASIISFIGSVVFAISALILGLISDIYGIVPAVVVGLFGGSSCMPIYVWLFRKHF